jgi:hypothetical protein
MGEEIVYGRSVGSPYEGSAHHSNDDARPCLVRLSHDILLSFASMSHSYGPEVRPACQVLSRRDAVALPGTAAVRILQRTCAQFRESIMRPVWAKALQSLASGQIAM